MTLSLLTALSLLSVEPETIEREDPHDTWRNNAKFFVGTRAGVGFSPGGQGPSPTFGVEMGLATRHGVGFGLHVLTSTNPQAVPFLGIPKASYAFGGAADLRIYIQTVEPLTLYPTISLGFLTGPDAVTGANVVLPMFNLGFGGRVHFGHIYATVEIGVASFHIPFVSLAFGYESRPRYTPPDDELEPLPTAEVPAAPAKVVQRREEEAVPTPPPPAAESEWRAIPPGRSAQ